MAALLFAPFASVQVEQCSFESTLSLVVIGEAHNSNPSKLPLASLVSAAHRVSLSIDKDLFLKFSSFE